MAGLGPVIHVFIAEKRKTWITGKASGSDAVLRTAMPGDDSLSLTADWIASSRSLSSGARSRDPLARNDKRVVAAQFYSAILGRYLTAG
jgi:hypothetical protein